MSAPENLPARKGDLSAQEERVLVLATQGLADKEVAARLGIRVDTVRTYWDRIRAKYAGATRAEIVADHARHEMHHVLEDIETRYRELKLRESLLQSFSDSIPQMAWARNADGDLLFVNRRMVEALGATFDQIMSSGLDAFTHPDDVPAAVKARSFTFKTGAPKDLQVRFRMADGTYRWHVCRALPHRDESGEIQHWFGTATDVHQMVETEIALVDSRRRLAEAETLGQTGSFEWNVSTGRAALSENLCRMLDLDSAVVDYDIESLFGKIHDDDRPLLRRALQSLILENRPVDTEVRLSRDGGEKSYFRCIAKPDSDGSHSRRVVATIQDVTAEREIRRRRLIFDIVVDQCVDFVGTAGLSGEVIYENRTLRERIAPSTSRVKDRHPEWALKVILDEGLPHALEHGSWVGETAFIGRDGEEIPTSQLIVAHRDESGDVAFVSTIARDVTETRQAARKLAESEAKFRAMAEYSPVGIFVTDAAGQSIYVNPECRRIVGLTLEEMVGAGWTQTLHPDDRARVGAEWFRCAEGGIEFVSEHRFQRPDGSIVWANCRSVAMSVDGEVVGHVGVLEDVTSERQLKDELQDAVRSFSMVFDSSEAAIIATDRDGTITQFNRAAERLLGYAASEVIGRMHPLDFVPPNEVEDLVQAVCGRTRRNQDPKTALMRGILRSACVVDHRWQTKSGSQLHVRTAASTVRRRDGTIRGMMGVVTDMTDAFSLGRQLDESRRLLGKIEAALPAILYIYDIERNVNVYANRNLFEILGYTMDTVQEMGPGFLQQLTHPDDWPVVVQRQADFVAGLIGMDGEPVETEYRMLHADGGYRWLLSRDVPFERHPDGRLRTMLGIATDVTQRKITELQHLEEMLSRSEMAVLLELRTDELERANQLLAKQAATDGLTGLLNHRMFQEHLQMEIDRARRYDLPLSLMMIDIDHFKRYNDDFGHPAGDDLLRMFAATLLREARSSDIVARYGGEEFVILLPGTGSVACARSAERVRAAIQNTQWPNRFVTVSIGHSSLRPSEWAGDLIQRADDALYESKRAGRNRTTDAEAIQSQSLESS